MKNFETKCTKILVGGRMLQAIFLLFSFSFVLHGVEHLLLLIFFFFFFFAASSSCRGSWARDWPWAIAVIWATVVTMLDSWAIRDLKKKIILGVPAVAQLHLCNASQDGGSIPGLAQRIQRCRSCGIGHNWGWNLIPRPGTLCTTGQPKKTKKQNKTKEKTLF